MLGDLSFDYFLDRNYVSKSEKEDILSDQEGFLGDDYSFVKISINVTNTFEKESVCNLETPQLLFQNMEMLEAGVWERGEQKWAERSILATMAGENDFDDYHYFKERRIKPGETKEFEYGIIVEDRFLNLENNYFLEVSPLIIDPYQLDSMAGIDTELIPSEEERLAHGGIDREERYICLNQFLEGYEPFRMPLDASKRETWKHYPFYYHGDWDYIE